MVIKLFRILKLHLVDLRLLLFQKLVDVLIDLQRMNRFSDYLALHNINSFCVPHDVDSNKILGFHLFSGDKQHLGIVPHMLALKLMLLGCGLLFPNVSKYLQSIPLYSGRLWPQYNPYLLELLKLFLVQLEMEQLSFIRLIKHKLYLRVGLDVLNIGPVCVHTIPQRLVGHDQNAVCRIL